METQIGKMAKQLAEHTKGGFSGNTQDNPKNEICKAIELRSKKVLTPLAPKVKFFIIKLLKIFLDNKQDHPVMQTTKESLKNLAWNFC